MFLENIQGFIFYFFYFIFHIYLSFTTKRIVSLFFGRDVRTRLGIAISEMFGPYAFHLKMGDVPLSVLPKDTTS